MDPRPNLPYLFNQVLSFFLNNFLKKLLIFSFRLLASNEAEAATQTLKSNGEKDKYKALARRLKDERNQYRETCEEKQWVENEPIFFFFKLENKNAIKSQK